MAAIPLANRLKKHSHKKIALAQDILVMEIYNHLPKAVLHGGTAIWRCYGGNRFSEDVDFYLLPSEKEGAGLELLLEKIKQRGFTLGKFKKTANSLFTKFTYQGTVVRFEALFKERREAVVKPYEMCDGTLMNVRTLEAEELLAEKVSAYNNRRKIRDLYDIFILLRVVRRNGELSRLLLELLKKFKEPEDSHILKALIITGAVPSVEDMLEEVGRWAG